MHLTGHRRQIKINEALKLIKIHGVTIIQECHGLTVDVLNEFTRLLPHNYVLHSPVLKSSGSTPLEEDPASGGILIVINKEC